MHSLVITVREMRPKHQLLTFGDIAQGVIVVQASRAGSGRVPPLRTAHPPGVVTADNLTPQKARVLLMLALTRSQARDDIQQMFQEY